MMLSPAALLVVVGWLVGQLRLGLVFPSALIRRLAHAILPCFPQCSDSSISPRNSKESAVNSPAEQLGRLGHWANASEPPAAGGTWQRDKSWEGKGGGLTCYGLLTTSGLCPGCRNRKVPIFSCCISAYSGRLLPLMLFPAPLLVVVGWLAVCVWALFSPLF